MTSPAIVERPAIIVAGAPPKPSDLVETSVSRRIGMGRDERRRD